MGEVHNSTSMMKFAVIALLVAVAVAQEEMSEMDKAVSGTVGPVGKSKDNSTDAIAAPLIAKLRANSNCAGDKCEPVPASCDPTIIGDCEKEMLPPSKISCDSIQHLTYARRRRLGLRLLLPGPVLRLPVMLGLLRRPHVRLVLVHDLMGRGFG